MGRLVKALNPTTKGHLPDRKVTQGSTNVYRYRNTDRLLKTERGEFYIVVNPNQGPAREPLKVLPKSPWVTDSSKLQKGALPCLFTVGDIGIEESEIMIIIAVVVVLRLVLLTL